MKRSLPLLGASQRITELNPAVQPGDLAFRPNYCVWEVTLRCDLSCKHCGSRAGKARPDELSTQECLSLIAQLAELGVQEVSLIGGEVYLREDWLTLIAAVRASGMRCGIVTGGRGMTRERANQAKEAGISGVSVSVDGLPSSHDFLRNLKGSQKAALCALAALREAGIPRAANTQINQVNRRELPALLELLHEQEIYGWQTQLTVAMGRAADHAELLLQPYDLLELIPQLAELSERCAALNIDFLPGNNIGYFGPHEQQLRRHWKAGHCQSCSAGGKTIGVEANGDIKGCPSLPSADYVGGNIRSAALRDIWYRAEPLRFNRSSRRAELWGFCKTCYYAEECQAGCSWTSHVLFGQRGNNPYCHHRALELAQRNLRERLEPLEAASGKPFDYGLLRLIEEPLPEPP